MFLGVLGPVELEGPAGPVPVPGHKLRQLLSLLALAAPEHVSRDRLVDSLWVEPPPSATKTLRAHVSRLRSVLAAAGASDAIAATATGYRLALGGSCDLDDVARLRRRAEAAQQGGDPAQAAELFGAAVARWRGEPELPDTPEGEVLRARLRDQKLHLLTAHLQTLIDADAPHLAVEQLGAAVAAEPLNERLWELRMLALYRSGRPTEALRAASEVRALLADRIGVEPGPAIRRLEAEILRHRVAPDASPAAGAPTAPPPTRRARAEIAYAAQGGVHLAYRRFGHEGDWVLLLNPGLISIDSVLDQPLLARAIEQLANRRRVLALDPRGIGLSDRTQPPVSITIDDWVDDVTTVLDDAGAGPVHVFAGGHGGLLGLSLAARTPERIRSITLCNAYARFTAAPGYPYGSDAATFAEILASLQAHDERPRVDALTLISPSMAGDAGYRAWWDAAGRRAASPAAAAALVAMVAALDLRHLLPSVVAPSLVVVRRGCPMYDPGHGEYLAAHLPVATLEQQHDVNDPWWVGDTDAIVTSFERFLAGLPSGR